MVFVHQCSRRWTLKNHHCIHNSRHSRCFFEFPPLRPRLDFVSWASMTTTWTAVRVSSLILLWVTTHFKMNHVAAISALVVTWATPIFREVTHFIALDKLWVHSVNLAFGDKSKPLFVMVLTNDFHEFAEICVLREGNCAISHLIAPFALLVTVFC